MKRAIDVIDQMKAFSRNEFTQKSLENTSAELFEVLHELRLEWMEPIHPSRNPDGWARFSGSVTTRHYAINRLSDAGDIFPVGNVIAFWQLCLRHPKIGGIGIYFDTKIGILQPGPMIHIDLRPRKLLWSRIKGKYHYFSNKDEIAGHCLTYKTMAEYLSELK